MYTWQRLILIAFVFCITVILNSCVAPKRPVSGVERDITPAVEWIKSNENKITEQQMFDTLRSKGWSEDEIRNALHRAKGRQKLLFKFKN